MSEKRQTGVVVRKEASAEAFKSCSASGNTAPDGQNVQQKNPGKRIGACVTTDSLVITNRAIPGSGSFYIYMCVYMVYIYSMYGTWYVGTPAADDGTP